MSLNAGSFTLHYSTTIHCRGTLMRYFLWLTFSVTALTCGISKATPAAILV